MNTDLLHILPPASWKLVTPEEPPKRPKPMLATLTEDYFSHPGWIFERKLDGERVLACLASTRVRLLSRNARDVSGTYPEIVEALTKAWEPEAFLGPLRELSRSRDDIPRPSRDSRLSALILDGEVVAFSGTVTSFTRLQQRMQPRKPDQAGDGPVPVFYYVFDVLHLGGFSLVDLPLRTRKRILQALLIFHDPLRFTPHRNENGEVFLREACHKGWEGIIAKRYDSPYRGARSGDWLKFKCVNRQELVVGGFTEPRGRRRGFGALLVGYYDEGGEELRYAGKVGTGFDNDTLAHIARLLRVRGRKTPPFAKSDRSELPRKGVHWVTPDLVGQFGFSEWTRHGKLSHARFLGLRRDKDPHEVVREGPGWE